MGIGRGKFSVAVCTAAFVAGLSMYAQPGAAFERRTGIWKVLRAGHFSGPMNEEAHVRPIKGVLNANGKHYRFWEHEWEEKRPFGHGRMLILVFEQASSSLSYIGCYEFEGSDFRGPVHPVIRGKRLFFPYHEIEIMGVKQAFSVSFEKGPPPALTPYGDFAFHR